MKKHNIITIILVLIIVILSGYIIYDKVLLDNKNDFVDNEITSDITSNKLDVNNNTSNYKNYTEDCSYGDTKCTANYTFTSNPNYKSIVDVEDIFSVIVRPEFGKQIYIVHNGVLYYDIEDCSDNGYCNYTRYDLYHDENYISKLNKFDKVTNIKKILSYNGSTSVSYDLLLLTENGDVYSLRYFDDFTLVKLDEFAEYKVDDVISFNYDVFGYDYKVILKDGTILTKTIDSE